MYDLAKFVVKENNSHHRSTGYKEEDHLGEIRMVYEEDVLLYESSLYYVAVFKNEIIGAAKITLWDGIAELPIQKLFDINCRELSMLKNKRSIWHVGRFAISKNENPLGAKLLKELLTLVIYTICSCPSSAMIAECDRKFLKILNLLQIRTKELAPSIEYLGSETIPIYVKDEWLKVFLIDNEYTQKVKILLHDLNYADALIPSNNIFTPSAELESNISFSKLGQEHILA